MWGDYLNLFAAAPWQILPDFWDQRRNRRWFLWFTTSQTWHLLLSTNFLHMSAFWCLSVYNQHRFVYPAFCHPENSINFCVCFFAAIGIIDVHNNDPEAIQVPFESCRITFYFVGVGMRQSLGSWKRAMVWELHPCLAWDELSLIEKVFLVHSHLSIL